MYMALVFALIMDLLKGALKSLRINQQDVLQLRRRESLSKYKYVPLPSDKSIRLFEFHPVNTGKRDIDLEMSIHSLEEAPSFECLSYMWGNPTFAFSRLTAQSNKEYGTNVEITISGGALLVARNLHDALKVLRRRTGCHATTHYYWVDAICIDQENIAERGQQVAIMDNIYCTARNTTVWVGPEDEFTKDAVMLIRDIGKIPLSRHGEVSPQHFNTEQDSTLKRLGCKPQSHKRWLGLIALLNRPYFSRVWIVQEILLSNAVLLVCGKHEVPWALLSNTISFLLTSGWYRSIGVLSFRELPFIVANPGVYKSMLEDKSLDIGMTVVQLETARTGMAQVGHLILFRHLLEAFRPSDASDARDKIYALIGLAWKERPPFSTHPDVLVPDYSLDTREVFIKTARLMFLGYGDLKYLCHVEDRSIRKMKGLPSWVPDYSVRLRPIPFYLLSSSGPRKYYSASKGLPFTLGNSTLLAPQLHVLGFRLSRIKSMARFKSLFTDDAPAVWELDPAWYKVCTFAANITTLQKRTLPP
ncbi:hypothetical protein GP486_001152 [Trichoglossum hirsutum]|uniref:Heterokaryon incompatibility domain-containing protein n=1 Tax=Trichoglossum hirsutum TaxID=265104 RepID=A0A9P8LHJ4_9PEZI|nr:hypothetical protein GP486_001152 [Trichoglossum hirsutum]